jgi:sigma-B regulation protein RsbU (phosphoserine phosphatase)
MFPAWKNGVRFGLTSKLAALFVVGTAVIFGPALTYHYIVARNMVLRTVETDARDLTDATVYRIESVLSGMKVLPHYVAQTRPLTRERIEELIVNELVANPSLFGSTVAFEPNAFDSASTYFAPYAYRKDGKIAVTYLGDDTYKYHELDWYLIPKELDQPLWSEPYYDEGGGNIAMATYSVPFYRNVNGERKFMGIVTIDISLDWLQEIVGGISIYQSGYAFILSHTGLCVAYPDPRYVMQESIFSAAEDTGDANLRRIGQDMIRGGHGFVPFTSLRSGEPCRLYYAPLPLSGWALGVVFPDEELFADLRQLFREVLLIGSSGFALWILVVVALSSRFTKPLRLLSRKTAEIATGDLDAQLPTVRSHDEVGELSRSFEKMRVSLKEYIENLTRTTAAKERIESELNVAHNIQMSFLRKIFPPFPDRKEFDLFAMLTPAKEVGGDLYDFMLIGGQRLYFCVGDVSDKGVPASLFMSVTQTLVRSAAQVLVDPDKVLTHVNAELCEENESMMFVTMFSATLNFETGELLFSNAGHNPPLVVRGGRRVEWLELPDGLVLGVMPKTPYQVRRIMLDPGDMIVAYTDGITEAMNEQRQLFSEQRLFDEVTARASMEPKALTEALHEAVKRHVRGAPQSDDITMLVVVYRGPEPVR